MQTKIREEDTIAAIATPPGEGAIGIIRISGARAFEIAQSIFSGSSPLDEKPGYTIVHGDLVDRSGNVVDDVLLSLFRAPHSYTGEDVVEVNCHGGILTTAKALEVVIENGARQADPGEFTKRAFLNKKLDLSQAEAVADLISARSDLAHRSSVGQLKGALGEAIRRIKSDLLEICSLLEIDLDFAEEGITVITGDEIEQRLAVSMVKVEEMLETFGTGRIIRDGIRVALIGPANVGKSSIFNALVGHGRAIVAETPGTTRDYIEEAISISGVLFSLVDTAGSRRTEDMVESQGVLRALEIESSCDLIVAVVDSSESGHSDFWENRLQLLNKKGTIVALNKTDLIPGKASRPSWLPGLNGTKEVFCSALTGFGLEDLKKELLEEATGSAGTLETGLRVTNVRHAAALENTRKSLIEALTSVRAGTSNEFIAMDVRGAVDAVSQIVGEVTTEDILNQVFGSFCVGK